MYNNECKVHYALYRQERVFDFGFSKMLKFTVKIKHLIELNFKMSDKR